MTVKNLQVVVGLGASGLSALRYLLSQNLPVAVTDTRLDPPGLAAIQKDYPQLRMALGGLDEALLDEAAEIILSPGLALTEPAIAKQLAKGKSVIGDIELFARAAKAPIIAITGSNAKSTVTTLVGLMMEAAGYEAKVGGNLGVPALDLLVSGDQVHDKLVYVLELSSFQLETTHTLAAKVATVLNVTPDHMDRYADFEAYKAAKQKIYQNCQMAVCNRDDAHTECGEKYQARRFYFTLNEPVQNEFGLIAQQGENFLAFEQELLMSVQELPVRGRHYQANALAALAIGHAFGLPMPSMLAVLREFKGLPHRCQWVREKNGVAWYNDSKGTNVGATQAALEGIGAEIKGKLILIAGGMGKGADFSPLAPAIQRYVRTTILIGEDAPLMAIAFQGQSEILFAKDMADAIVRAEQKAHPGDSVLLSPACASYDMFRNFEHRGEVFMQLVKELEPCEGS